MGTKLNQRQFFSIIPNDSVRVAVCLVFEYQLHGLNGRDNLAISSKVRIVKRSDLAEAMSSF